MREDRKEKNGREDLLEGLFQGEGALPRPPEEELRGLRETLETFSRLPSPEPSRRVLEGVRRLLEKEERRSRRKESPRAEKGNLALFREALRESWLVKGLAAALLVQILALPILGAVSYFRAERVRGVEIRTGVDLKNMIERIVPAQEEVRKETGPAEAGPFLEEEKGDSSYPSLSFSYREWLVQENRFKTKWYFTSFRKKAGKAARPSPERGLERFVTLLSRALAGGLSRVGDPLDLALGIRALFLAGNSEKALEEDLPRLLRAWNEAGRAAKVETAVLLSEMELLGVGGRRKRVEKAMGWLLENFAGKGEALEGVPYWALADAAQALGWAPILLHKNPGRALKKIREELERRARGGGDEALGARAALERVFPKDLPPSVGEGARRDWKDPFLLLQLSWRPGSGSAAGVGTLRLIREGRFPPPTSLGFREKAAWLLAVGACYAAPIK